MSDITFGMIKPNAVKRGLQDDMFNLIEQNGLSIVKHREVVLTKEEAESFYAEHSEKAWFPELIEFMTSGPVIAFVLKGANAVKHYREVIGATDPAEAAAGTVRAIFGESKDKNSIHGSDSPESADREIAFFWPNSAF